MAFISIQNLFKQYGSAVAVDGISIDVEKGSLLTLLGPSGCGKTTTLRCLAGLERPDGGEILIDGESVYSGATGKFVPPENRGLGMVFQSYAIWPHMTVLQNVMFPLKIRGGLSKSECRERALEALDMVGLKDFADRPATKISGGQQQRVAVARALVYRPRVLLFDEPLSNLDAKLRERMRFELLRLQREVGITSVYVTHDQEEAMGISDQIVVMSGGCIEQIGKPTEIYRTPKTEFVAEFIGTGNLMSGEITAGNGSDGNGAVVIRDAAEAFEIKCPIPDELGQGQAVAVAVRAESLKVARDASPTATNVWPAEVMEMHYTGHSYDCVLKVRGRNMRATVEGAFDLNVGESLFASIEPKSCVLVRKAERQNV